MKYLKYLSGVAILILWELFAIIINNDVFVPYPYDVLLRIVTIITNDKFIIIIFNTLQRVITSFSISLILGLVLGLIAGINIKIELLFRPLNNIIKSIPNISYMFILLLYAGSNKAIYYIIFFITFPIIYNCVLNSTKELDDDLQNVLVLYQETFTNKLCKIYLPNTIPYLKSILVSTFSLALKVCIMSEVLGQCKYGIGKEMYVNKINLDITGVFAWTAIVIIITYVLEKVLKILTN